MRKIQITKNFLIFLIVILLLCFVNALDGEVGGGIGIDITIVQEGDSIPDEPIIDDDLTDTKKSSHTSSSRQSSPEEEIVVLSFENKTEKQETIVIQKLKSVDESEPNKNIFYGLIGTTTLLLLTILLLLLYLKSDFIGFK